MKTRLRAKKINLIKAEKYERHPNARLHLILTKEKQKTQLYQCPFASRCLSEEVLKCLHK